MWLVCTTIKTGNHHLIQEMNRSLSSALERERCQITSELIHLNTVERAVPAGKIIHAIAYNYGTHKHPKVKKWLVEHPRWVLHFTPTSASWLNAV